MRTTCLKHLFSLIVLLLLVGSSLYAGKEEFVNRIHSSSIKVNEWMEVKDDKYDYMQNNPSWTSQFKHLSVWDNIILRINKANETVYAAYTASVTLEITYYDKNGAVQNLTTTLSVDYDPAAGSSYKNQDYFRFEGGHKVQVKIIGRSSSLSSFPFSLELLTEIDVDRLYFFNPTHIPGIDAHSIQSNEKIEFYWNSLDGAEEYDLEFAFIDDYDGVGGYVSTSNLSFDFEKFVTRVTTSNTFYQIPYVFEHGYLVYRVRGVGRHINDPDGRLEGQWSGVLVNGSLNLFSDRISVTNTHVADDLNWVFSSSYFEKGKKVEEAAYSDGLLLSRQKVGMNQSIDESYVHEIFYDYQGRPSVTTIPSPTGQKALKYYANFNLNGSGVPYSAADFDLDPNDNCSISTDSMSVQSGASKYFSPHNPDMEGQQAFVPDAEKYPFSRTEYTPDRSGRVSRKGGFGLEHQLGSGHEKQNFYGDPLQDKLNRLFGTDVGWEENYKEVMIIDPNGQISSSYHNQLGQVVATSMAGDANPEMNPLSSNQGALRDTTSLMGVNNVHVNSNDESVIEMSRTYLVKSDGNYNFDYGITAETFTDNCLDTDICFDCIYDLEMSITDKCGDEKIPGGVVKQTIGTLPWDSTCTDPVTYNHNFTVYLEKGAYTITKTLTVNKEAVEYYTDQYLENDTCLLSYEDFLQPILDSLDFTGCDLNECEIGCLETMGTKAAFISGGGTAVEYDSLFQQCMLNCYRPRPCAGLYDAMLQDFNPGGQYALYLDTNMQQNPSLFALSILNTANQLPDLNADWRHPVFPYQDENGVPDSIYVNGIKYPPNHANVLFG